MNFLHTLKRSFTRRRKIDILIAGIFLLFLIPQMASAGIWDSIECIGSPFLCAASGMTNVWLKMMAWLVGFAGIILNAVLRYTVVDMKLHINDLNSIEQVWKTLRDLANMTFIFILLYASIKTILGDSKIAQQTIKNIVIVALFINFSLFGTKILIDASNVATLLFYSQIAPEATTGGSVVSTGLSNTFVQPLKIQSLYAASDVQSYANIFIVGFMGSIFLIVVSFVFAAVAFFFLIRYLVLILVLMFSPLAFASFILPGLKGYGDKWKSALTSQLLFAPVFMIFAWIIVVFLNDPKFLGALSAGNPSTISSALTGISSASDPSSVGTGAGDDSSFNLIINFFLAIGLMITALTTAQSISAKGGSMVGKATSWASDKAKAGMGASTFGLAGRLGRNTLGRGGDAMANDVELRTRALSGDRIAKLQLATAERASKYSFDGRGKVSGFGKSQKGGFSGDIKEKEKQLQEQVKKIATTYKEKEQNKKQTDLAEEELKKAKNSQKETQEKMKAYKAEKSKELLAAEEAENAALASSLEKSPELLAAEKAEESARERAESKLIIPGETEGTKKASLEAARLETEKIRKELEATRAAELEKARAAADELRKAHEASEAEYIKAQIDAEAQKVKAAEESFKASKEVNQGADRANYAAEVKEKKAAYWKSKKFVPHVDKVFLFGKVMKKEVEDAPRIIRQAVKKKTPEQEAAEAMKKLAKAEADAEKASEVPAATEPKPSSPITPK